MPESALPESSTPSQRVAKRLARAGVCSRRDAERLIQERRVALNGQILDSPAVLVTAEDRLTVDGVPVPAPAPPRLWRLHKPAGLVTTARDPQGRKTVFQILPPALPRVVSIGRLDLNSEGLLLLTNDGDLARHLELPATGWRRRYRVRAMGALNLADLAQLKNGAIIDGIRYGPVEAQVERRTGANVWLQMSLTEGKNREVRRILDAMGLRVNRLIRLAYGPFQLGDMAPGRVEEVPWRVMKDQIGSRILEGLGS